MEFHLDKIPMHHVFKSRQRNNLYMNKCDILTRDGARKRKKSWICAPEKKNMKKEGRIESDNNICVTEK